MRSPQAPANSSQPPVEKENIAEPVESPPSPEQRPYNILDVRLDRATFLLWFYEVYFNCAEPCHLPFMRLLGPAGAFETLGQVKVSVNISE